MLITADTVAGRAYRALREDIVRGRLAPGAVLGEVELAGRLGASRTPVREALTQLVADGLAEKAEGRGLVVTAVDPGDLDRVYELRGALDPLVAELAARRGEPAVFAGFARRFAQARPGLRPGASTAVVEDYYALVDAFDAALEAATGNAFLVDAVTGLRLHAARLRKLARDAPDRLADSAAEHQLIAEAVAARDAALAVHATHVHLYRTLSHARTQVDGAAPAH